MKWEYAGRSVRGLLISSADVTDVDVKLTPAGIEEYLGSREFTLTYRYLGSIPLTIVYCDEVDEDAGLVIKDAFEIYEPILVFRHDRPIGPLSDFEVTAVLDSLHVVKTKGVCQLRLRGLTETPGTLRIGVIDG